MICKNGYKIEFDYNNKMYCCMGCEEWPVNVANNGFLGIVNTTTIIVDTVIRQLWTQTRGGING